MAHEILSQQEVDALVATLARGEGEQQEPELEEASLQAYDFSRPTRFSRDSLRSLRAIHEAYGRLMSGMLSSQLRARSQINVVSVSQTTYEEFLRSTPVPTVLTQFKLGEEMGSALMCLEPALALSIVVLALGGRPDSEQASRDLTETELAIMREFSGKLLTGLSYSWQGVAELEPTIEQVHTDPQSSRVAPLSEAVVLVSATVELGPVSGLLSFCYPHISIGHVLSALNNDVTLASAALPSGVKLQRFQVASFDGVSVELQACMGDAWLTLDDVAALRPGQVLDLDRAEGDDIEISFEGLPIFHGQPGVLGGNLAVRFSGWAEASRDQRQTAGS